MRYAEPKYGEQPIALGIFSPGDTVTITIIDLTTDTALPLTASGCTESSVVSGFFSFSTSGLVTELSGFHQCLYVMENQDGRQHPGKIVIGGYPSDSARARFEGFVHIDVASGEAGTDYDIGTPQRPVSNVADARTIADRENIPAFKVRGGITISGNYADWSFEGIEPTDDHVTFTSAAVTSGAQFFQMGVRGTLGGAVTCQECLIGTPGGTVSGVQGLFNTCGGDGTLKIAPNGLFQALDFASQSLVPGLVLDLTDSGAGLVIVGHGTGIFNLVGLPNGRLFGMSLAGGELALANTCSGGIAYLYGYGEVTDGSTGSIVLDSVLKGSQLQAVHDTDLPAVAADVTAIGTELTAVSGDVAQVILTLGTVSGEVTAIGTELTVVSGDVAAIGTELTVVSGDVAQLAITLGVVSGEVTVIGTELTAVSGDVAAVAADVERLYGRNARTRLHFASGAITGARNVPDGAASHMETQVKTDAQADWSSPVTFFTVFNYSATATATSSPEAAEPATSAPTDGSFVAGDWP